MIINISFYIFSAWMDGWRRGEKEDKKKTSTKEKGDKEDKKKDSSKEKGDKKEKKKK